MKIKYSRLNELPFLVRVYATGYNAWIVGGGAKYVLGLEDDNPRDWDILVPLENWNKACRTFPKGSPTNTYGGIKLTDANGIEIDVWGDSLSNFIQVQDFVPNYAVQLNTSSILTIGKGVSF